MTIEALKTIVSAGLFFCCCHQLFAVDPVRMPLDQLYTTAIENVPEQVHVTQMLDYYGRARMDALVHILEEVPRHWQYIGDGRLSVSGKY